MALQFITGYVLGSRNLGRAAGLAASASSFADSPTGRIHALNDRIDRLVLVVEAMWSLLEESGFNEEDLAARISQLDQADGEADGKRAQETGRCEDCGAVIGRGLPNCQFCGHPTGQIDPFGQV